MATLDQLKEAIYFEEPYMFLVHYIAYIKMGHDPQFPDRHTVNEVKIQWQRIFQYLAIDTTASFLTSLAQFWVDVTEGVDTAIDTDNLEEIEEKMKKRMFEAEQQEREAEEDAFKVRIAGLKKSVQLMMSQDIQIQNYYDTLPVLDQTEWHQQLQKSVSRKDANTFLDLILSVHRSKKMPDLPKTFDLEKCGIQWRSIIQAHGCGDAKDPFIAILEAKWFFLIHTMGIPQTLDAVRDMHYFIKQNPKKLEVKPEDRNKFLNRKLNLKPFQQDGKY